MTTPVKRRGAIRSNASSQVNHLQDKRVGRTVVVWSCRRRWRFLDLCGPSLLRPCIWQLQICARAWRLRLVVANPVFARLSPFSAAMALSGVLLPELSVHFCNVVSGCARVRVSAQSAVQWRIFCSARLLSALVVWRATSQVQKVCSHVPTSQNGSRHPTRRAHGLRAARPAPPAPAEATLAECWRASGDIGPWRWRRVVLSTEREASRTRDSAQTQQGIRVAWMHHRSSVGTCCFAIPHVLDTIELPFVLDGNTSGRGNGLRMRACRSRQLQANAR